MMRINHVAMYVNDLECIKEFYIKYFKGTPNKMYHNEKTGLSTYFLTFNDASEGVRLEIMSRPECEDNQKSSYRTGYVHLAFSVGSKEEVDKLTGLLKTDGFTVLSGPRTTGDGYYESCVLDPENNQIEIVE